MSILLKDDNGVPVPQYTTESGLSFESLTGKDGAMNVCSPTLLAAINALNDTMLTVQQAVESLAPLLEAIKANTTPETTTTE